MANWCNNTVAFEGKPEAIEQIERLFKAMAEQEQKEERGQLPDFAKDRNEGYFFNIYRDDDVTGVVQYETRWSPNTEIVQAIAEHYKVDFTQDYEELGCLVYGRATYVDGILTDICLDDEDFEAYSYDEEIDTYHFEGEEYESDFEILETLLERKLAQL